MFAQLVRFRLLEETAREDFLALTGRAGREFLAHQPGFLGREVFEACDGAWHGLYSWLDARSCHAAGELWSHHPLAAELGGLADAESLSITDLDLRHRDAGLPPDPDSLHRGAIVWIPGGGSQGIPHPHLVIQDDVLNRSRIPTVTVCALTSNPGRANEPGNVLLDEGEGGLPRRSVVVVSQVSTVAKASLGAYVGSLSERRVDQVLAGLRFQQASGFTR